MASPDRPNSDAPLNVPPSEVTPPDVTPSGGKRLRHHRVIPFVPGVGSSRSKDLLHLAAHVVLVPIAIVGALGSLFLWKLAHGPVDVTLISRLVEPVAIAAGPRPGHPAGRLSWDRLRVQWQPSAGGVPAGLVLMARGLRVTRYDGIVAERADEADAVLSLSALFEGTLAPRTLKMQNATLALRRLPDGDVDFDLPQQKRGGRGTPTRIDRLRALDIHNVTITLAGLPQGRTMVIGPVEIVARRIPTSPHGRDFVWTGEGRAPVVMGGFQSVISARAAQDGPFGRVHVSAAAFEPASLAVLAPDLAPVLASWRVPMSVEADAVLVSRRMDLLPSTLAVDLNLAAGQVFQAAAAPIQLRSGKARVVLRMDHPGISGAARVEVPSAALEVLDSDGAPTHVQASAALRLDDLRAPKVLDAQATAGLDAVRFATLGSIWPASVIKGGRRWICRNITEGTGRDLSVTAHLHSDRGFAGMRPVAMQGRLVGRDLTVHWLRPVPPAIGLNATLGFDGPDTLVMSVGGGTQPAGENGTLSIPDGEIRIGNLYGKDQTGDIALHITGGLPGFLTVLSHPRLHLLSRHPLPFTRTSGEVDAHARLTLPLVAHLPDGSMHVWTQGRFTDVHLGNVLMGRPVDGATGSFSATEAGMDLTGDGRLSGIVGHVALHENFQAGAPDRVVQTIDARSVLDPQSVAAANLAPAGLFEGHPVLTAHFVQKADAGSDLALGLDMLDAALHTPIWAKPRGDAAVARAHIGFRDGEMNALDGLQAHGRDLSVAGRGLTRAGRLTGIVLEGFRIGRSEGDARISLPQTPGAPVAVSVDADSLDLAPLFSDDARKARSHATRSRAPEGARMTGRMGGSAKNTTDWAITLHAAHVYYGPRAQVGGVVSDVVLHDGRLRSGRFAMDAPTRVRARLADQGANHLFVADIDDLGSLLSGLGLYDRIRGGRTHLEGTFTPDVAAAVTRKVPQGRDVDRAGLWGGLPPFRGQVTIGPSTFLRPPLTLTAVSDLSPLHWATNKIDRFEIARLSTTLDLAGNILVLRDGVIGNQALGATVEGPIDLTTTGLHLKGTIVPLFGLNALPGKLPLVGHLMAPEKGGGLLAATFALNGTVEAPDLTVNPLAMLLPGVLRRILN